MATKRNYTKERLNETPARKKARVKRNAARRQLTREGKVKKGDGKHVDHKKPLRSGGSTKRSNLRPRSAKSNSAANGHKKGETQKKWKK